MRAPRTTPASTAQRLLRRIRARGPGSVFVPADFLDLGSRAAVDAALSRLARAGRIRRIGRGLYDWPRVHPRFGTLPPAADAVASAVARSHGEDVCCGDAAAAQRLGMTTQVPARAVYLTDGTSRLVHVDLGEGTGYTIELRRSRRRAGGDSRAGLLLRALWFLGPEGPDAFTLSELRFALDESDLRQVRRLRGRAPGWMRPTLDRVVAQGTARREPVGVHTSDADEPTPNG